VVLLEFLTVMMQIQIYNTLSLRQNTVNVNIIHISQGFARVSKTTDIPPNSIQNIKIRLSKTKSNETVLFPDFAVYCLIDPLSFYYSYQ
jgi:uncharacterized protein (DUF486 family)